MELHNTENNNNTVQTEPEKERQHFLNTPERFRETASKFYPDLANEINGTIDKEEPEESEEPEGITGEYQFDLPDGFVINEANIEEATATFKEMNLSNENVQKLISMEAKYLQQIEDAKMNEYNGMIEDWKQQSIKELGQNSKNEIPHGIKFRDTFFSKDTIQFLDSIGVLNHPLVVRDFIQGGKKLNESRLVKETNYSSRKSAAEALYPNTFQDYQFPNSPQLK